MQWRAMIIINVRSLKYLGSKRMEQGQRQANISSASSSASRLVSANLLDIPQTREPCVSTHSTIAPWSLFAILLNSVGDRSSTAIGGLNTFSPAVFKLMEGGNSCRRKRRWLISYLPRIQTSQECDEFGSSVHVRNVERMRSTHSTR